MFDWPIRLLSRIYLLYHVCLLHFAPAHSITANQSITEVYLNVTYCTSLSLWFCDCQCINVFHDSLRGTWYNQGIAIILASALDQTTHPWSTSYLLVQEATLMPTLLSKKKTSYMVYHAKTHGKPCKFTHTWNVEKRESILIYNLLKFSSHNQLQPHFKP